jgi:hypothetical protein
MLVREVLIENPVALAKLIDRLLRTREYYAKKIVGSTRPAAQAVLQAKKEVHGKGAELNPSIEQLQALAKQGQRVEDSMSYKAMKMSKGPAQGTKGFDAAELEKKDALIQIKELIKDIPVLSEDGRIVKGVNTTVDVGPDEIKRQAAKFGNTVDRDGRPPTLSSKVKGKSTNVLFNLGLTESRIQQLEASYEGNVGIMELIKFFNTAPKDLVSQVKELIKQHDDKEVWKIVQQYTNVKLKGKEFE